MTRPAIIPFHSQTPLERWPDYPGSEIAAGARSCQGRRLFEDKKLELAAGLWEADANIGRWTDYPYSELVIVLEGEVVMAEPDRETVIGPGEAFVMPQGLRCAWHQAGPVRKIFVAFTDPGFAPPSREQHVIKLDPAVKLEPSTPPSPAMLLSPVPVQNTHDYFTDATGQLNIGVWDTTGYTRRLIDFPRYELMHLLEGSVTFEDDQGRKQSYSAGDTFFVPLGTPNSWRSEGYLKKIFAIFQPRS